MHILLAIIFCIGLLLVKPEHLPSYLKIFRQGLITILLILRPIAFLMFIGLMIYGGYEKYRGYVFEKRAKIYRDSLDIVNARQAIQDSLDQIEYEKQAAIDEKIANELAEKENNDILQKNKAHLIGAWAIAFNEYSTKAYYNGVYEFKNDGEIYQDSVMIGSWELDINENLLIHLSEKSFHFLTPQDFYSKKSVTVTDQEEVDSYLPRVKNVVLTKRSWSKSDKEQPITASF